MPDNHHIMMLHYFIDNKCRFVSNNQHLGSAVFDEPFLVSLGEIHARGQMEAAECRVTLPRDLADLGLRFFEGPFDAGGANVLPHVFPHIHAHVAAAFECI